MFGGITDVFKNIPGLSTLSTAMDLVQGIMSGDLNKIMSSVSQLALTYATGGAGALFGQLTPMVQNMGSDLVAKVLSGAMSVETGLATVQMIGEQMCLGQNDIDAAQGAFAEAVGDRDLARTNYREAGFNDRGSDGDRRGWLGGYRGNRVTDGERAGARDLLGGILAGPNPTPVGIGQANGLANMLLGGLMDAMISSVFSALLGGGAGGAAGNGATASTDNVQGSQSGPSTVDVMNTNRSNDIGREEEEREKKPGQMASEIANELGISTGGFLMQFAMLLGEALDKKSDDLLKVAKDINQQTSEFASIDASGEGASVEVAEGNSRLQTLGAIMNGISKEMDTLQNALKTSLDSLGQAQSNLARRQ